MHKNVFILSFFILFSVFFFQGAVHAVTVYSNNFENNNGGFVSTGTYHQWEWGKPTNVGPATVPSGIKCWGTRIAKNYKEYADEYLTVTNINLTALASAKLSFSHWYATGDDYDGGYLSVSEDNGSTWQIIYPCVDFYDQTIWMPDNSRQMAYTGMNGSNPAWDTAEFNLTRFCGKHINICFNFISSHDDVASGWYIDDVKVSDEALNVSESLSLTKTADCIVTNISPTNSSLTLLAFQVQDFTNGHTMSSLTVRNMHEISGPCCLQLWRDTGTTPGVWDSGDTYVQDLYSSGSSSEWRSFFLIEDVYNSGSGQSYVITMAPSYLRTLLPNESLRLYIAEDDINCSSGSFNTGYIVNGKEQTIKREAINAKIRFNIPATNFSPGQINAVVFSFNVTDRSNGHALNYFELKNYGYPQPMQANSDISNMKLWEDNGTIPGQWDSGDTFVKSLYYSPFANGWTNSGFGVDIYNSGAGCNFIVTVDISHTAAFYGSFQGYMGRVECNHLGINTNSDTDHTSRNPSSQTIFDHKIAIKKNIDVPYTNISPGSSNVAVLALNILDNVPGDTLSYFHLRNASFDLGIGMENGVDITNIKLWIDDGTIPGKWDSNDHFIKKLLFDSWTHDGWTNSGFGANLYNAGAGLNVIVTIDIPLTATPGTSFQATINKLDIRCSGVGGNMNELNNKNVITIFKKGSDGAGTCYMGIGRSFFPGSTNNMGLGVEFTAEGIMDGGKISFEIPAGWTAPQITDINKPGYVSYFSADQEYASENVSLGIPQITGSGPWTVTYPVISLKTHQNFIFQYGLYYSHLNLSGGVKAPSIPEEYLFTVKSSTNNGVLTECADGSPMAVTVRTDQSGFLGTGTAAITPAASIATNTIGKWTIRYTAKTNISSDCALIFTVPAGWSSVQNTNRNGKGFFYLTNTMGLSLDSQCVMNFIFVECEGIQKNQYFDVVFTNMQARNTSGTDTFVVASLYSDYPYEKIKLSPSIIVTGTPLDTTPPSRAVLLSPANGSAYKTNMLQLNWNRATDNLSGVSNYSVQISTNKFINVFTNYNALGTNCAVSLLNNKKWYWRVKASDKAGNQGAWSLTNIFYIDTIPPVLSGRTPSSNKVTGSLCVKFQWDAQDSLSGIFSNLMEIDTNKDLMPDIITVLPSLVSGYSNTFTHNGTNRWRIVAVDAAQNTNRSSWYSIVINTNLPVPVLLTPLNNSATNNTTVRFDWSNEKNKGMISNIIQISSNNFVTLTFRSNLQTNNCSVYLLSGQYQWRVVAFSSVSSYTSITPFSLTIDSIPPSLVLGQPSGTYISEINFRITAFKTASHVVIDTNAVVTAVVTENDLLKGTYSQSNGRFNMPLGEGKTYLIRCYAVDKLNNHSATNTVEYKILKGLNAPAAIYPTIVNLNKSKKMKFVLSEKKAGVLIKIYTLRGSLVKEINNADLSSGFFEWEIDNLSLFPAGRYIVLIDNKKTYLVIVK